MHLLGIMWTNHERPEKRRCEMVDKWWLYAEIYVITDRAFRNATLTKLKIYALWVACQNQVRKMLVSVPSLAAIVMIALLWRVYNHLHLSRLEASQDPPSTSNNHAPQQIIHSSGLQVVLWNAQSLNGKHVFFHQSSLRTTSIIFATIRRVFTNDPMIHRSYELLRLVYMSLDPQCFCGALKALCRLHRPSIDGGAPVNSSRRRRRLTNKDGSAACSVQSFNVA